MLEQRRLSQTKTGHVHGSVKMAVSVNMMEYRQYPDKSVGKYENNLIAPALTRTKGSNECPDKRSTTTN